MSVPSVPQAPQLPAYLQDFGDFGLSESITGGLSAGGHPRINIKGRNWRLQEGAAEELVNSLSLDVVIVDANKFMSKVYYMGKYNPTDTEFKAPDCFSDNGTAPSAQSAAPQNTLCATCPHNVWGSKVSENGAKVKACADYKKLAVVLADDPARNVYELRIPGASLKDLNKIMSRLIANRVPIPSLIFRLTFDPNVDYPKIVFTPTSYVTEEIANGVRQWLGSNESKEAVGSTDIPLAPGTQIAPPAPSHQVQSFAPPQGVVQQPMPQAPNPYAPPPVMPSTPAVNITSAPAHEPVKRGRGRPAAKATGFEPQAPMPQTSQGVQAAPPTGQMQMDLPGVTAPAQAVPIAPNQTDAALDALLEGILK